MLSRFVRHRSRLPLGAAVAGIGVLCVTAAVALAGHPAPGAHYKGQIQNDPVNTKIKFKVSNDGTKVKGLKTKADPVFFSDGCDEVTPDVEQESDAAHISRKGKFKGVIHYTYSNDATAKAVVKGRFRRHHKARGTVKATFPANPACDGKAPFSAKVR
jgi:hypothetical protein